MNKGYSKGHSIDAPMTHCALEFPETNFMRQLTVIVHEMAPFTNASDFCLYIDDNPQPKTCSGSGKIGASFGPFNSSSRWDLRFKLANTSNYVPKVRFWMDINGKGFIILCVIIDQVMRNHLISHSSLGDQAFDVVGQRIILLKEAAFSQ